jgi:hypothetical protein
MGLLSSLVCAWLATASAGSLPGAVQPGGVSPAAFAVAVVRNDGTLVPVGTFDGRAWTPADSAPAASWHVWLMDDPAVKTSPFAPRTSRPVTTTAVPGSQRCLTTTGLAEAAGDDLLGVATSAAGFASSC